MIPLIRSLFVPYSCRHCQICVCYLVSCGRSGYTATWLNADDAVTRLACVKVGGTVKECDPAAQGVSRVEVANASISDSVRLELGRDNLQVRLPHYPGLSDNVYLQNYACGYLNGRYRKITVNYAPTK